MVAESRPVTGWSDAYLVGVPEMDDQHRRLVELISRFYDSLSDRAPAREALADLVCGILDYTRYHFTTEERLMREWGYPEAEAHRDQHGGFIARAVSLADRFTQGQLVLSIEATSFLREWILSHIQGTDRALARHILACRERI
jgi:hemerythrin